MVGKAQKSPGARSELNSAFGLEKVVLVEHLPYSPDLPHAISGLFQP
jgi:hypothetical protein